MMSKGGDWWGARPIEVKGIKSASTTSRINSIYGDTPTTITRPDGMRYLGMQVQADQFYLKQGYHPTAPSVDRDLTVGTDVIKHIAAVFEPGATAQFAAPGTINRIGGIFAAEGFEVGQTVVITGTVSSNGTFVILSIPTAAQMVTSATTFSGEVTALHDMKGYVGHGLTSGDGPYQMGVADAAGTNLTQIYVSSVGDPILVRDDAGSWLLDGFTAGQRITIVGSVANDGTYTIASIDTTAFAHDTITIVGSWPGADEGPITLTVCDGIPAKLIPGTNVMIQAGAEIWASGPLWADMGFAAGQTFTLVGSAADDGTYTVASVASIILTTVEGGLVGEAGQTDLVIESACVLPPGLDVLTDYYVGVVDAFSYTIHTSQRDAVKGINPIDLTAPADAGGGSYTLGAMTSAAPAATNEEGQEAILVSTTAGIRIISAGSQVTLLGTAATAAMIYWWIP